MRLYRADTGRWDTDVFPDDMNRVYLDEIQGFLRAIRGDAGLGATLEEGFRVLQIALAVKRAAAERREVACPA